MNILVFTVKEKIDIIWWLLKIFHAVYQLVIFPFKKKKAKQFILDKCICLLVKHPKFNSPLPVMEIVQKHRHFSKSINSLKLLNN